MDEKRRSVAPTSWRAKGSMIEIEPQSTIDQKFLPNALRTATAAGNHFRKVTKMFSFDKTREVIRGALEDSDRVLYVSRACEHEELVKEWKSLKGFIKEMCDRYEQARSLDPIRRYKKMQSMTKTLVLSFKMNDPTSITPSTIGNSPVGEGVNGLIIGDVLQSSVKLKEMKLKHEKAANLLTTEELIRESEKLRRENAELQARIDEQVDAINDLEIKYNCTKTESFVKRYNLLKQAIKELQRFAEFDEL